MNRDPYQIAIVGPSGRGKTYSFRNMNKNTTGFINIESKPLPFKNEFKYYHKTTSWQDTYSKLIEYAKDPEIEVVVLDSFSAYAESLLKTSRDIKKNYEIWNHHNDEIGKLIINLIKSYPKDIFVTAHTESIEIDGGIDEKRISIKGNEWKGKIENNFTMVVYANVKLTENDREYYFELNSDGKTSAKTPPMFFENKSVVPNDSNEIIAEIKKVLE